MTMLRQGAALALLCLLALGGPAAAQTYPDRPVKIIVPIGPGGSYDLVGRLMAEQLSKRFPQGFFVENKPGAGTIVGTQAAVTSPADGYTLLVGGLSNIVFNAALYSKLPYDPLRDLKPVALFYTFPYVLIANKELPFRTLDDIVKAAKDKPDSISIANAGVGTGQQLVAAAFMKAAGIKFLEVPYKGVTAAYPDLFAGRVDLFFDSASAALPHIQADKVRGIALAGPKRSALIASVPTMAEAGIKGFDIESWLGLFVPAATPEPVVEKLRAEIKAVLPELKARFEQSGGNVIEMTPAETGAFIKAEYDAWTKVIKDAGLKLD